MKPATAAVASAGGTAAIVAAFTAGSVGEWLTIAERIVASPASLLVVCLLLLVLVLYLLVMQRKVGDECEERVARLEHALNTIYSMLASDTNWAGQLPSWNDLLDGKIDAHSVARARNAPAFNRERAP